MSVSVRDPGQTPNSWMSMRLNDASVLISRLVPAHVHAGAASANDTIAHSEFAFMNPRLEHRDADEAVESIPSLSHLFYLAILIFLDR